MASTAHTAQEIPLACDLTAIPAGQREQHTLLAKQLFFEAAPERRELANGYAFVFRAGDYERLAQFIGNERLCCPFFSFTLELAPARGPITLSITGAGGIKQFIRSEFMAGE